MAPTVTYHLARTLAIDDPQAAAEEYLRFTRQYATAFEWLYRLENLLDAEDWLDYRLDPQ